MNWFTEEFDKNRISYMAARPECDFCEHTEHDHSKIFVVTKEKDSFGDVGWYAQCEACYKSSQEDKEAEEVICHDCGKIVTRKEVREWKWYDFYAAQGDEPLLICEDCWNRPQHAERRKRDRRDREIELVNSITSRFSVISPRLR